MKQFQTQIIGGGGTYLVQLGVSYFLEVIADGDITEFDLPSVVNNFGGSFEVRVVAPANPTLFNLITFVCDGGDKLEIPSCSIIPATTVNAAASPLFPPFAYGVVFTATILSDSSPGWLGVPSVPSIIASPPGIPDFGLGVTAGDSLLATYGSGPGGYAPGAGSTGGNSAPAYFMSGPGGSAPDATGTGGNSGPTHLDTGVQGPGPAANGVAGPVLVAANNSEYVGVGRTSGTTNVQVSHTGTLQSRGLASHAPRVITFADSPFNLSFMSSDLYNGTAPVSVTLLADTTGGDILVNLPEIQDLTGQDGLSMLGQSFRIVNIGATGYGVSVLASITPAQTINGAPFAAIGNSPWAAMEFEIVADGASTNPGWGVTQQSLGISPTITPSSTFVNTAGSYNLYAFQRVVASFTTGTVEFLLPPAFASANGWIELFLSLDGLDADASFKITPDGSEILYDTGDPSLGPGDSWEFGPPGDGTILSIRLESALGTWIVRRLPHYALSGMNGASTSIAGKNVAVTGGAGYAGGAVGGAGGNASLIAGPGGDGSAVGGAGGLTTVDAASGGAAPSAGAGGVVSIAEIFSQTVNSGRSDKTTVWTHTGRFIAPQFGRLNNGQTSAFTANAGSIDVWAVPAGTTTVCTLPDHATLQGDGEEFIIVITSVGAAGLISFAVAGGSGDTLKGPALTAITPVVGSTYQFTNIGSDWYVLGRYL